MTRQQTRRTSLLCFASAIALLGASAHAGSVKYPLAYCEAPLPELVPIDTNSYSLAQVSLITRHGDRTPLTLMADESEVTWDKCTYKEFQAPEVDPSVSYQKVVIPTYEYAPKMLWKGDCMSGQLTKRGAEQHYNIGKRMREIYIEKLGFLPAKLNVSEIYVRSTDVWRTKVSAIFDLAGMFPAEARAAGETIKYEVYPYDLDTGYPNSKACPKMMTHINACKNSSEWLAHEAELDSLLEKMARVCGTERLPARKYTDAFHTRVCHGMSLPCNKQTGECVTDEDAQRIFDAGDFEKYMLYAWGEGITPTVVGFFAGEVYENIKKGLTEGTPRYAYYSAHDDTLTGLLGGFGLEAAKVWPPYASSFILETWASKNVRGQYYVRIIFNGELQKVPACKNPELCTFEEFSSIIKKTFLVTDYTAQCAV